MSHFTVMVIGEDIEKQLAPYHEFECTGQDDEFVIDVDMMKEAVRLFEKHGEDAESFLKWAKGWYGLETVLAGTPTTKHPYGFIEVDSHDGVLRVINHTNPNAKWDWYSIGGRWTGFFKLKSIHTSGAMVGSPGLMTDPPEKGYADSCLKKDIDFEGMDREAFEKNNARYDEFEKLKEENPLQAQTQLWKFNIRNTGDAVNPIIETREQYLTRLGASLITYAVIKDGKWYEKGEMGWFGQSFNEKEPEVWDEEFKKLMDSLDDKTRLTVVDCHI